MQSTIASAAEMVNADWQRQGACKGTTGDLFFHEGNEDTNSAAKTLCRQCPVVLECLRHALLNREEHGIWGGLTTRERRWARLPRLRGWDTIPFS